MDYQITIPEISAAAITPNPVDMNRQATLTVTVTERIIQLQPEIYYSGDLYSGEV